LSLSRGTESDGPTAVASGNRFAFVFEMSNGLQLRLRREGDPNEGMHLRCTTGSPSMHAW